MPRLFDFNLFQWWRARKSAAIQIPDALWTATESALPFLHRLNATERLRLRQLAHEFIAAKQWTGAQGLPLTPEIQLTIALQACLPILNLGLEWYADWVGIVVYPGDFVVQRQVVDEDGVVHEFADELVGEAWDGGPVVISWFAHPDDLSDINAHNNTHHINAVIHEFSHKLDMRSGAADGMPPLHAGMSKRAWISSFSNAFDDFQQRVDLGAPTKLDPYAAEHPAEFFAVASEAFFETPEILKSAYPEVYAQLALFYRQNPAG